VTENQIEKMKTIEKTIQSKMQKAFNSKKDFETKEVSINQETKKFEPLETTDRFLKDAVKGSGFTFNNSISEFIDNSLDAGSKRITITAIPIKKDLYNLIIEDDGCGIDSLIIKDVIKKIGYGNLSNYKSNSISNYGLGMKFAMINLCQFGECKITSIKNTIKSTVYLDNNDIPLVSDVFVSNTNDINGTKIEIPNVKTTSNQITSLIKYLGVTYFPHVDNGNNLEIIIINDNKEKFVEFTDPLYRNVNNSITYKEGISVNNTHIDLNYKDSSYRVFLRARHFDHSFNENNLSSWDIQQGTAGFSGTKSGVYFRLNGRYITLGNGDYYVRTSNQAGSNRNRIEVDIDRDLISLMGIGFNKSKISIDKEDPAIKDFVDNLHDLITWCVQKYSEHNKSNSKQSSEEEKELEDINKDINARRRKMSPIVDNNKVDTKGTKNRPSNIGPYNKNEDTTKKVGNLEIRMDLPGKDRVFWFGNENGRFIIRFSTEHEFYNYYKRLNYDSKNLINKLIASLCESIHQSKFTQQSVDHDQFDSIQDVLMMIFSQRLGAYNKD
jgi:hypothetical protein